MKPASRVPLCAPCANAELVVHSALPFADPGFPSMADLVNTLPLLLENALAHLLAEIDYDEHADDNLNVAARLLATGAARAVLLRQHTGLR